MAQFTHATFQVNDDGGGAPTREFDFDTISQGDGYKVTITYPGSGPSVANLSKSNPTVSIPDSTARVKPTGTLTLSWDTTTEGALILFTGTLNTMHSVTMTNVCVGAVD